MTGIALLGFITVPGLHAAEKKQSVTGH